MNISYMLLRQGTTSQVKYILIFLIKYRNLPDLLVGHSNRTRLVQQVKSLAIIELLLYCETAKIFYRAFRATRQSFSEYKPKIS